MHRSIFNHFYEIGAKSYRVRRNNANCMAITPFKVIQGHRFWYQSKAHMHFRISGLYTVSQKTKQICFCQNFVKFPPILIIFGRKMENDPNICKVHSFSTSPNLCHHLTMLNANVPICYITPKLLVIDRSHWRPPFIRGRRTFRDHWNFRQFVHS